MVVAPDALYEYVHEYTVWLARSLASVLVHVHGDRALGTLKRSPIGVRLPVVGDRRLERAPQPLVLVLELKQLPLIEPDRPAPVFAHIDA